MLPPTKKKPLPLKFSTKGSEDHAQHTFLDSAPLEGSLTCGSCFQTCTRGSPFPPHGAPSCSFCPIPSLSAKCWLIVSLAPHPHPAPPPSSGEPPAVRGHVVTASSTPAQSSADVREPRYSHEPCPTANRSLYLGFLPKKHKPLGPGNLWMWLSRGHCIAHVRGPAWRPGKIPPTGPKNPRPSLPPSPPLPPPPVPAGG